jgi:hypothetical protein
MNAAMPNAPGFSVCRRGRDGMLAPTDERRRIARLAFRPRRRAARVALTEASSGPIVQGLVR